nr:calmodulin-like protein 9 [Ipomoea batatas]
MIGESIPVFDGRNSNYETWSKAMKAFLKSHNLWGLVKEGYKEKGRRATSLKKDREMDSLALLIILQAVDKSVRRSTIHANTSKDTWDAIQNKFPGSSLLGNLKPLISKTWRFGKALGMAATTSSGISCIGFPEENDKKDRTWSLDLVIFDIDCKVSPDDESVYSKSSPEMNPSAAHRYINSRASISDPLGKAARRELAGTAQSCGS